MRLAKDYDARYTFKQNQCILIVDYSMVDLSLDDDIYLLCNYVVQVEN